GGEGGVLSDPARRDEFLASLSVIGTVHERTGCPVFNALYGQRRAGLGEAEQRECALANLREATSALPDTATVVLEALTVGENGDYPLTTCAEIAEVLDAAGPGPALLFDTYHLTNNGDDLPACVDRYAGRIGHVQLADSPGRHEPGTGSIDFDAVLKALAEHGYSGA